MSRFEKKPFSWSYSLCAAPGDSRPVFVDRLSRPKSSKFMRFGYDATTLARCALRNGQVPAEVHFKTRHNINLDPHSLHNFRIFEATAWRLLLLERATHSRHFELLKSKIGNQELILGQF